MEAILERYERYSYEERQLTESEAETQGRWNLESSKLKAKIEVLEKNIRNYVGEDLEPLNLRELQSIEQLIETALKRVRTRKNQAMHESISELHKKVIYKSVAKTSANTLRHCCQYLMSSGGFRKSL
ncbi:putative transcription factor, K-box [Helianthus anomalus]